VHWIEPLPLQPAVALLAAFSAIYPTFTNRTLRTLEKFNFLYLYFDLEPATGSTGTGFLRRKTIKGRCHAGC
jgi:hypothetical protein